MSSRSNTYEVSHLSFLFVHFFQDNIGVFVDQNGKLIQDGRIIWSDTPASVVIHKPYAVARLPRHVEVSCFVLCIGW